MFFLPLISSEDVFYSRDTGVNWDVLFLLLGMMIIVSVVRQTGAFEYVAIWSAKRAKGSPLRIMILLILVTTLGTAVLDNVTTVLLIAPVTLLVCDRLAVNPAPYLVIEAIAANIAGAATLVGDPTSIIIGTGAHLSFIEFSANMAPAVLLVLVALIAMLPVLYPGFWVVDPGAGRRRHVAGRTRSDPRFKLLWQCGIVLAVVFTGFVLHKQIHMEPSMVAMAGAGILIVISGLEREFYLASVEWETLLFFAGLFVMVGALVRTGVIKELAKVASNFAHGDAWTATLLILTVSFTLGNFIDNVPYAAAMTPIVGQFADSIPGHAGSGVLWWALLLGTVMGRQPHSHRRQCEHRRGRDRATPGASRLVLGFHQTRRGSDRGVIRVFRWATCGCATSPSGNSWPYGGLVRLRTSTSSSPSWTWIPTPSMPPG